MEHKIKSVKEFIKDGPPQFDVILRHTKGEPTSFSVHSENEDMSLDYSEMVYPGPESEGLIKIVKRICDDAVFHINDMVEAAGIGSCFIIGFSEDLINCTVIDVFAQDSKKENEPDKKLVQINHIEITELIDDESEEDNWPEPDSAIDEW